jgi:hypothetical protein
MLLYYASHNCQERIGKRANRYLNAEKLISEKQTKDLQNRCRIEIGVGERDLNGYLRIHGH